MSDLTELLPEHFFRLAIERGGLDLEEVIHDLSPEAAAALRHIAAAPVPDSTAKGVPPPQTRSAAGPALDEASEEPMSELTRGAVSRASRSAQRGASPSSPMRGGETTRDARPRQRTCPACGFSTPAGDRFCRRCGWDLGQPAPAITLDDMVAEEQITAGQADELRARLLDLQNNYPAGARYSIFGGPL